MTLSNGLVTLSTRLANWTTKTFGKELLFNEEERTCRLVEEVFELAQACKLPKEKILLILERTYSRPLGEKGQEAAGVFLCILAWALTQTKRTPVTDFLYHVYREIDRLEAGDKEKFRKKQLAKFEAGTGMAPQLVE